MPISLSSMILAGGQSLRMGEDKALLVFCNQPLIRLIYDVASSCSDRTIVVTPWCDRYREHLPDTCEYLEESNPTAEPTGISQGPLAAFILGLTEIDTDWVLLLACDLPLLRPEPIQFWKTQLEHLPTQISAFLPRQGERWEPLCGFYRRSCLPSLRSFTEAGGRSFQKWLQTEAVQPILLSPKEARMLHNCNTPADWIQIAKREML